MRNLLRKSDLDSTKTYYEYIEVEVETENRMPQYFIMPTGKKVGDHFLQLAISRESGKVLSVKTIGKHYQLKSKWL